MPTYRYRFTGLAEEDFPALPPPVIARRLQPGDEIELQEPVEHARLELVLSKTRKTAGGEPASTEKE